MTDQELLDRVNGLLDAQNQAETAEEFDRLDVEVDELLLEMKKRDLTLEDLNRH